MFQGNSVASDFLKPRWGLPAPAATFPGLFPHFTALRDISPRRKNEGNEKRGFKDEKRLAHGLLPISGTTTTRFPAFQSPIPLLSFLGSEHTSHRTRILTPKQKSTARGPILVSRTKPRLSSMRGRTPEAGLTQPTNQKAVWQAEGSARSLTSLPSGAGLSLISIIPLTSSPEALLLVEGGIGTRSFCSRIISKR